MSDIHSLVGQPKSVPADVAHSCLCVKKHQPNNLIVHQHHIHPVGQGGPDVGWNRVWLCPTGHYNVHYLLDAMLKNKGIVPRGQHNRYLLSLARRGYDAIQAAV